MTFPQHTLAIIPARGGSKGLPRKNVLPLLGRPLIAHSIEQARAARRVTRVVVSTDDDEIAAASRAAGAEVITRPAALSGDGATSESALVHVLDTLEVHEGYVPDLVVFLQCTAPLRLPGDIDGAVNALLEDGADSLLSLAPFRHFLWRVDAQGGLHSFNFDYRQRPHSRDLPPVFMENGSIYVFKPWVLRETGNRLGGQFMHYAMHPLSALDIDTQADFDLCAAVMASGWPPV